MEWMKVLQINFKYRSTKQNKKSHLLDLAIHDNTALSSTSVHAVCLSMLMISIINLADMTKHLNTYTIN